ncbi:MAG: DnaJ domain-containing protein [Candidatus Schekmanbacteria bacterium]|nr:DnaJ domain-containing protein [Candidatus Schekmanbacteria bacterium]
MPRSDYYKILGLAPGASITEIKRAYRKLAHRYHPDKNPDDPWAEERFKEATEAYQALIGNGEGAGGGVGRGGRAAPPANGRSGHSYEDHYESSAEWRSTFDSDRRKRRKPRTDRHVDLEVDLHVLVSQDPVAVRVSRLEKCPRCDGGGAEPGTALSACPTCYGRGTYAIQQGLFSTYKVCAHCSGAGTLIEVPCSSCHGLGGIETQRTLSIRFPAGTSEGAQLKLAGQGDWDRDARECGDLHVRLRIRRHDLFERKGADIALELPVGFPLLALGATVTVPTLAGERQLRIPPGTQSGTMFRLRGEGLPRRDGASRGDLIVTLKVDVPENLSRAQREALEQYQAATAASDDTGIMPTPAGRGVRHLIRRLVSVLVPPPPPPGPRS